MENIPAFLAAMWMHWWPLMSCAVFTALSVIATRIKEDPGKWIRRGSATLAIFFFGLASFFAWNDEHKARLSAESQLKESAPQLSAEIIASAHARFSGFGFKNVPEFTLWVSIVNRGSPSTFSISRVIVHHLNGESSEAKIVFFLPKDWTLHGAVGTPDIQLPREQALVALQRGQPIEKEGSITGWIMCLAPQISQPEIKGGGISVTFEGRDIDGKVFSATAKYGVDKQ